MNLHPVVTEASTSTLLAYGGQQQRLINVLLGFTVY